MSASTVEGRIFVALARHLAGLPGGRTVVWPNMIYPVAGAEKADEYLVISHSPGTPERRDIDPSAEHIMRGVFGISLMTMPDAGQQSVADVAGAIADYFQGRVLSEQSVRLRVTQRPYVAGGYLDRDRWRTPVTVEYETIAI